MNKIKTDQIRQYLVRKMESIRSAAHQTKSDLKNNVDRLADPLDMAVVEASNGIELNCRGKEWYLLLDIKETIMRIDHGLFGICDRCGCSISAKRLRHAPMSKLCITCQEELEYQHSKSQTKGRYHTGRISYDHA